MALLLFTRSNWLVRLVSALCALTINGVVHALYNCPTLVGVRLALLTTPSSRAAMSLLLPMTFVETSARAVLMLMVILNIIGCVFSLSGSTGGIAAAV